MRLVQHAFVPVADSISHCMINQKSYKDHVTLTAFNFVALYMHKYFFKHSINSCTIVCVVKKEKEIKVRTNTQIYIN